MRRKHEQQGQRFHEIGDTCGFYDEFTMQFAFELNPDIPQQRIRDAVRDMVKHGTLKRVKKATYRWTGK